MASMLRSRAFAPFTSARPQMNFSRSTLLQAPGAQRMQRGALQVRAADDEKVVVKKAIPSPVKRAMLAEERRLYNRSRKSACSTRIKKVMKLATLMTSTPPASEADVKPLELLVAEAYQEIDKAVIKGVLHKNNGARKKARVARYKRQVLMVAGLFTPLESHPEYNKFIRLTKSRAAKLAAPAAGAPGPKATAKAGGKAAGKPKAKKA